MSEHDVSLNRRERLLDSKRQTTSMSLPLAVHYRLARLAELADAAKASRAEIIAMLIAEAELDPSSLARRVIDYRQKTVGDVVAPLAPSEPDSDRVVVPLGQPGRPRRRARG
jgi:hypothetical protein